MIRERIPEYDSVIPVRSSQVAKNTDHVRDKLWNDFEFLNFQSV